MGNSHTTASISMLLVTTIWILLTVHISQTWGGRYFYRKSNLTNQCRCNYTEIFTELPYFLQELGRNEKFDWVFQGKKGDRGADGPQGPAGLPGIGGDGKKGERGDPGPRGLPGTSLLFNPKGSFFGSEHGEKGNIGPRGPNGRKGTKGEPGTTFTTVLKDGSYFEVKGQKGDRGSRGRKGQKGEQGNTGLPGQHGLSIEGQKGQKGEPAEMLDFERLQRLQGSPGPRGPPGLPGYPGRGCHQSGGADGQSSGCSLPPIVFQRKGEKGDTGHPGLSIQGEKGESGPQGPPGPPSSFSNGFTGVISFKSEREMKLQIDLGPGIIGFVASGERAFIKVPTGWKEIMLGSSLPTLSEDVEENNFSHNSLEPINSGHYGFDDDQRSQKLFFMGKPSTEKRRYWRRHPNKDRNRSNKLDG